MGTDVTLCWSGTKAVFRGKMMSTGLGTLNVRSLWGIQMEMSGRWFCKWDGKAEWKAGNSRVTCLEVEVKATGLVRPSGREGRKGVKGNMRGCGKIPTLWKWKRCIAEKEMKNQQNVKSQERKSSNKLLRTCKKFCQS